MLWSEARTSSIGSGSPATRAFRNLSRNVSAMRSAIWRRNRCALNIQNCPLPQGNAAPSGPQRPWQVSQCLH